MALTGWHDDAFETNSPRGGSPASCRCHILSRAVRDSDICNQSRTNVFQELHAWLFCKEMSQIGGTAPSEPRFRLSSKNIIEQIAHLLAHARQERIAIHFEDLSLESPDEQVQILNLQLTSSESQTHEQRGRDAPSVIPSNEILADLQAERDRVQIEGEEAGSFIYPVGSYGKPFIALTWILLLKDRAFQKAHDVTLETRACILYNAKRDKDRYSAIWLPSNPSILDLLNHVRGFACVNKYLIAPDGTSLLSENEEFLRVAERVTHDKYGDSKESRFEYSNANYIFLGIILELLTGKPLWLLVKEMIIDKLDLTDTTFSIEDLRSKESERVLIDGMRVSADGSRSAVDKFNHLANVVQYASLGLRSSQRDLATFNREILLALDGGGRLGLDEADLKKLFAGEPMAPYGYFTELGQRIYNESPNEHLFPKRYIPYRLGKLREQEKGMDFAFRKAGYIDGFGCNVTLMPKRRISLIVLGNATGAIDTTFHVSNLILQEALRLSPPVNIIEQAIEEGKLCRATLSQIETPENLTQILPASAGDLAGTYEHERYEQRITVHEDGTIQFHTRTKTSSKMNLVHIGPDMLMVRPGKQGLSFETWSVWRDLRFQIQRGRDGLALAHPDEKYAYKIHAGGTIPQDTAAHN